MKQEVKDEVIEEVKPILDKIGMIVKSITEVDHNPHPYTIGPKHVGHAADKHGGMLGKATLDEVDCAVPGCTLSYDSHTYATVMFLQHTRDVTKKEAQAPFKKAGKILEKHKVDGFAFVATKEKFRFVG